ncbi:TetR family transcriptional regulator [Streptomyces sp. NPDC005492]|uniref:TetR/AcrR family transcriptional regulator n=1 Tax=Streptomyces sp. NPDC005492 TaxID=3156883 RepID=UPI0033A16AEF
METQHSKKAVRKYNSPLRARQAAETRRRILDAAILRFGEHGYTRTTLRDIAREAEVSSDSVQAQGSKADIFLAAFDLALVGDDQAFPLREQPDLSDAYAAETLERFYAFGCAFLAESSRRSASMWVAFFGAAANDPHLAEAYEAKTAAMRAESVTAVRFLISRELISPPRNIDVLADELWATAHIAQYVLLVRQAGWNEEQYVEWLTDTMIATVRRHCG